MYGGKKPPGIKLRNAIKESVEKFISIEGYFPKLILLKNHGIITSSSSIKDCIISTFMCEKSAEIFIGAKILNNISFLSEKEIAEINKDPNEKYRRNLIK